MLLRQLPSLLFPVLLLSGCGASAPELPGFDAAAWRRDAYACQGARQRQAQTLVRAKEELYGVRAAVVEQLLGPPDEEELAEQTEKTYYYYLEFGSQCRPDHQRSAANKLSIRFSPLGTVKEVLTERPVTGKM